jgi:hypothetical protein
MSAACRPFGLVKCVVHAEALRFGIHARDKSLFGAADIFGDGHRNVVRRFDDHHLQRIVEAHHLAGLEAHLARRLSRGILRHLDRRAHLELTGGERAEGDVGRHQLGERGRVPAAESILVRQHGAGLQVEKDGRIGESRRRRRKHAGKQGRSRDPRHHRNPAQKLDHHQPAVPFCVIA